MTITAIHKEDGKITLYKLDNGKIVETKKCIKLVKDGKTENYNVGINRSHKEYIRADRKAKDGSQKAKSLKELPVF